MSVAVVLVLATLGQVQPDTYVVQPNDTCSSIALKVYGDGKRYDELHRYNELGPLPHLLKPGQVLRLRPAPAAVTADGSPDATLTFLKPAVRTRHLVDWKAASLGMGLYRLDEVNTLKGAGAELTFRDASFLLMEENALIVVYGEGMTEPRGPRGLTLVDGELRLALSALRRSALGVKTRSADVSLEQRAEGVVSVDSSLTSRLSLFEGHAQVAASGEQVKVQPNHGTRIKAGQGPEPERVLPATPVLEGGALVAVLWHEGGASAVLRWPVAERAVEYRAQLARDANFVDRVFDARTTALNSEAAALPVGHFLARVIGFDEAGLQSRPSAVQRVEVVRLDGQRDASGAVWLAARAPLTVQTPEGVTMLVDGAPAASALAVGTHAVEFRLGEQLLLSVRVEVFPSAPVVTREARERLLLSFSDELPTSTTALRVVCGERVIAPTSRDAHHFTLETTQVGACVAKWHERVLSAFDVK